MSDAPHVLVTGAAGLVGSAVTTELLQRGHRVTATELNTPANRKTLDQIGKSAPRSPDAFRISWADLTDAQAVTELLETTVPDAVIHLAAVIPPVCYMNRRLARKVNVDGTRHLVSACVALDTPPHFLLASSIAVYGPRNPHRVTGPLTAETPVAPGDLYGGHKVAAEEIVTSSGLTWTILRLGGVLTATPPITVDLASPAKSLAFARDMAAFGMMLPADGRLQSVAVEDVARAFANAAHAANTSSAEVANTVHLIGGDESHSRLQDEIARRMVEAIGLRGAVPPGRPGNPDDDHAWFATDWMDTRSSQAALNFQTVTFDELMAQAADRIGPVRHLLPAFGPLANIGMRLISPYRGYPGKYADHWTLIRKRWGSPDPDHL